jgi:hypothetical protein
VVVTVQIGVKEKHLLPMPPILRRGWRMKQLQKIAINKEAIKSDRLVHFGY